MVTKTSLALLLTWALRSCHPPQIFLERFLAPSELSRQYLPLNPRSLDPWCAHYSLEAPVTSIMVSEELLGLHMWRTWGSPTTLHTLAWGGRGGPVEPLLDRMVGILFRTWLRWEGECSGISAVQIHLSIFWPTLNLRLTPHQSYPRLLVKVTGATTSQTTTVVPALQVLHSLIEHSFF